MIPTPATNAATPWRQAAAIEHGARELDVQYLLGHSSPDMVRRYASSYNCEQAARRHASFSPDEALGSRALVGARADGVEVTE
jgi:integrase